MEKKNRRGKLGETDSHHESPQRDEKVCGSKTCPPPWGA